MAPRRQATNKMDTMTLTLSSTESILERFGFGFIVANADLSVVYASQSARRWTSHDVHLCEALSTICPDKTSTELSALAAQAMSSSEPVRLIGTLCRKPSDDLVELPIALTKYVGQPETKDSGELMVLLGPIPDIRTPADDTIQPDPLAALGRLTARIAHELNNPLDGISRYVNLALRLADDTNPSKLKHYLSESRSGLVRMTRIIADLLEYSRSVCATEEMPLQRVVEDAIQAVSASVNMNGIIVTVNFKTTSLPPVVGPRLYQVCCNLIKNAVDAMPDGGRLTITVGTVNNSVMIRIEDNGTGLPCDTEQIFEPFYTTKKPGEGTGLGLAICKEYITSMGGTIQAEPGEKDGAVLTLVIPIEQLRIGNDG